MLRKLGIRSLLRPQSTRDTFSTNKPFLLARVFRCSSSSAVDQQKYFFNVQDSKKRTFFLKHEKPFRLPRYSFRHRSKFTRLLLCTAHIVYIYNYLAIGALGLSYSPAISLYNIYLLQTELGQYTSIFYRQISAFSIFNCLM